MLGSVKKSWDTAVPNGYVMLLWALSMYVHVNVVGVGV